MNTDSEGTTKGRTFVVVVGPEAHTQASMVVLARKRAGEKITLRSYVRGLIESDYKRLQGETSAKDEPKGKAQGNERGRGKAGKSR